MKDQIKIRTALLADVDGIYDLLELYVAQGIVLKRSKEDISFFIGNFTVAEYQGKVCGCAALRDYGNDLLELRSVVISPELQGRGIGRSLGHFIIEKLKKERQEWRLFTLTTTPAFFRSLGFREVVKEAFPEKIWSDCSKCPKCHCCDETALLITS